MWRRCARRPATSRGSLGAFDEAREPENGSAPAAAAEEVVVPPLTQLRRTYLMCERDDGVLLIDQHSAHERVLYEQFMRTLASGRRAIAAAALSAHAASRAGGGGSVRGESRDLREARLRGRGIRRPHAHRERVPMPHPRFDAERCLRDTLGALTGDRTAADSRGTSGSPRPSRARPRSKRATSSRRARCARSTRRSRARRCPRTTCTAARRSCRSGWDELERRFGRR